MLVPGDRVQDFESAHGAFAAGQNMSDPRGDSSASNWQAVGVQVADARVPDFYIAFAAWLTTAAAPKAALTEMSPDELKTAFPLLPSTEKELLHLLADDRGRVVGWTEMATKFALAGKPSAEQALPHLAAKCASMDRGLPVHQKGDDDKAVFSLPLGHVAVVAKL